MTCKQSERVADQVRVVFLFCFVFPQSGGLGLGLGLGCPVAAGLHGPPCDCLSVLAVDFKKKKKLFFFFFFLSLLSLVLFLFFEGSFYQQH